MVQAAAAAVWGCATSSRTRRLLTELGAVQALLAVLQQSLTMPAAPPADTSSMDVATGSVPVGRDQLQVRMPCKVTCHLLFRADVYNQRKPHRAQLLHSSALSRIASPKGRCQTLHQAMHSHCAYFVEVEPQHVSCTASTHFLDGSHNWIGASGP